MQKKFEELYRVKEIGFMGKVTASLSHEIKNTLAIINESAGLMGDLLRKLYGLKAFIDYFFEKIKLSKA